MRGRSEVTTAPSLKSWRMRGRWRADQRRMEVRSEAESTTSEGSLGMEDDRSGRGGWDGKIRGGEGSVGGEVGEEDDRSRRGGWGWMMAGVGGEVGDGGWPEAALLGQCRKKDVTTHEGLSPYIVYY